MPKNDPLVDFLVLSCFNKNVLQSLLGTNRNGQHFEILESRYDKIF